MRIVARFGEMWARNAENIRRVPRGKDGGVGVYVLYDGSMPVYVGKGHMRSRIGKARGSATRGQMWDHFRWYALHNEEMTHDVESLVLRMLPPYLRSLTKQKGTFVKAERVKQLNKDRDAEYISRKIQH